MLINTDSVEKYIKFLYWKVLSNNLIFASEALSGPLRKVTALVANLV